tara:strand:- start:13353 stop:14240 length:888 start_codon:yes stop_codon:yes gene_type:complete
MMASQKLNVIYILSEKSSGSSFLFRSLTDAMKIKAYPVTKHFESETLYWTKAASVLQLPQLKMLASSVPYTATRARAEIVEFLEQNLGFLPSHEDDRELIFRGWFEIIKKFGPSFIEKSPHHLLQKSALRLMKEFELEYKDVLNCHYVCIVRNPKDVFLSQFRRWNVKPVELENQWIINYMNWFSFSSSSPESCTLLKYEDLVLNQSEITSRICSALGVESQTTFKESSRKSKASKQSSFFGHTFSESVYHLASLLGYTKQDITGRSNLKWSIYHSYVRFIYTPAKRLYTSLRGI